MLFSRVRPFLFSLPFGSSVCAVCGLHYLSTLRSGAPLDRLVCGRITSADYRPLILPIVITILTTYSQMDLGANPLATTNVKKPLAAIMFSDNGLWADEWFCRCAMDGVVVLPMLVLIVPFSIVAFRTEWIARNRFGLFSGISLVLCRSLLCGCIPGFSFI